MSDCKSKSSKRWGNTTSKEGEVSRVFVGNIPHSTQTGEVEDKFKPYGDIEGIDINPNGFAFVQFRSIEEAKMAVSSENGSFLGGRKIECKLFDKTGVNKKSRNDGRFNRDRSPIRRGHRGRTPEPFAPGFHPQQQQPFQPQFPQQQQQQFNMGINNMPPMVGQGIIGQPMGIMSQQIPHQNEIQQQSDEPQQHPPQQQQSNDVEIIVINRDQWGYGEVVEKRLKEQAGIPRVDMLFLHSPQHISMTLNDLFDRGTLYAVVVAPENENHGTVTIHVLQTQTEYRNISLDKAVGIIGSDFYSSSRTGPPQMNKPMNGSVEGFASSSSHETPSSTPKRLPEEIAYLLRTTLAEQGVQFLSLQQIDSIIHFFSHERDKLSSLNNFGSGPVASGGDRQAVQSGSRADIKSTQPTVLQQQGSNPPVASNLLDNPQVKQALSALASIGAIGSGNAINSGSQASNSSQPSYSSSSSYNYGHHEASNGSLGYPSGVQRRDQVTGSATSRLPPSSSNSSLGQRQSGGPGLFGGPVPGRF